MRRRERWLSNIALITSVLPLLLMGFVIKLMPEEVPIINFTSAAAGEYASKYNNLFVGFFCIVPLSIALISRYLKSRIPNYNIVPILVISILIGVIFTGVVMFGVAQQLETLNSLEESLLRFDYIGFAALIICLVIAMLSTTLRYSKYKGFSPFRNRNTKSSEAVWKVCHSHFATFESVMFVILAIPIALINGYAAFIILGIGILAFLIWGHIYSYFVKISYERKSREREDAINQIA